MSFIASSSPNLAVSLLLHGLLWLNIKTQVSGVYHA